MFHQAPLPLVSVIFFVEYSVILYTFFVNMLFAFIFINFKSYWLSNLNGIVLLAEQAHGLGGFFVSHAGLGMGFGSAFVEDSVQFGIVDELAVTLLDRFQR